MGIRRTRQPPGVFMNNEDRQLLYHLDQRLRHAARLTSALGEQCKESARLEAEIRKNLAGLGDAV
jgi:hypothetical protein